MKNFYLPIIFFSLSLVVLSWAPPNFESEIQFPQELFDYSNSKVDIDNKLANLGRILFYDPLLSQEKNTSCASCHKQEFSFADNTPTSRGHNGLPSRRNSMHLNDLGWQPSKGLFWDFREDDLEEMVLQPILDPNELGLQLRELKTRMEDTYYYPPLFEYAFGDKEIYKNRIGKALAEFVRSITTEHNPNVETQSEFNGRFLFNRDCASCHAGSHTGLHRFKSPLSSNVNWFLIRNNGLDSIYSDLGMWEWKARKGDPDSKYEALFKTPTLRNVEYTAPYMHDGRFESLEEVVDFYSEGVQSHTNAFTVYYGGSSGQFIGFEYNEQEKKSLVDFLKTLSDPLVTYLPKWSDPFPVPPQQEVEQISYNIHAAPNPVETYSNIYISNALQQNYDLVLVSMSGKIVRKMKSQGGKFRLERESLPKGIYFLKITTEKFDYSLKLEFL